MSYFPCDIPFMSDEELKENGINIPKDVSDTKVGNIEYIRKQEAIDAFGLSEKTRKYGGDHSGYDTRMLYEIQDTIESLKPADVAPVVHAHWKDNKNGTVSCSRCSTWFLKERVRYLHFCGYCGARMDGKREE